jgi:hypothetical protein
MTPPDLPARFPARRLLNVVSLIVGTLAFCLLLSIVLLALLGEDSVGAPIGCVAAPALLIPGFFVFKRISDRFSVLELTAEGVRIRKWIGGKLVEWGEIGSVRFWEAIQVVYGAQSREGFLELHCKEGKGLLRLGSTYEPAAYSGIIEGAKARPIPVNLGAS